MAAKSKRFNKQNNNFARAEFTCSTLCRHCTTAIWKSLTRRLWRTETDVNTTLPLNFSFPFLNRVPSPRFQFQGNIRTFDNQNEFSCNNYDKLWKQTRASFTQYCTAPEMIPKLIAWPRNDRNPEMIPIFLLVDPEMTLQELWNGD